MKQVILMRTDLDMGKGKMIAQGAHAAVVNSDWPDNCSIVVVKVSSEEELLNLIDKAADLDVPNCYIRDAGRTQTEPGTITCGAIGPAKEDIVDTITSHLKLL